MSAADLDAVISLPPTAVENEPSDGQDAIPETEKKVSDYVEVTEPEPDIPYFGLFECACGREWKSRSVYKDVMQQCIVCKTGAVPSKYFVLKYQRSYLEEGDPRPPRLHRRRRSKNNRAKDTDTDAEPQTEPTQISEGDAKLEEEERKSDASKHSDDEDEKPRVSPRHKKELCGKCAEVGNCVEWGRDQRAKRGLDEPAEAAANMTRERRPRNRRNRHRGRREANPTDDKAGDKDTPEAEGAPKAEASAATRKRRRQRKRTSKKPAAAAEGEMATGATTAATTTETGQAETTEPVKKPRRRAGRRNRRRGETKAPSEHAENPEHVENTAATVDA